MLRLAGVTLESGDTADVLIADGRVAAVRPPDGLDGLDGGLDLTGHLLLPAPAEPHAHLDKALSWDSVGCGDGDLVQAIQAWRAWSATMTAADVRSRALRALRSLVANGTTAVRTHVDLGRLDVVEEILAVRAEAADSVTVQVVALAAPDHPDAQITAALELGADLVGGAPHLADDPHAETLRLIGLAEAAGAGVDLHTDEQLHPDVLSLVSLARVVIDRRFAPPVTASHCVSLGLLPPDRLKAVIDVLLEAGIGIVALPITNLYLQGRGLPTSPPRGLTAVRALLDAGVPVAAGGDNIRDPFNPMGRADPLEAASLLVTAGHLSTAEAYAAVSTGARRVLGLSPAGSTAGMAADLLAIRAATLAEAVGEAGPERTVVRAGRVIGSTRVTRTGFEEFC